MPAPRVRTTKAKRVLEAEFTRPANATQYTALDAVGTSTTNVLTFDAGEYTGSTIRINSVRFFKSDGTDVTGASFRLHLYKSAPTAIADNATNTVLYADRANYLGLVDSGTMVTSGTGSAAFITVNPSPALTVVVGSTGNIYGALEAVGTYTPASSETFSIGMTVEVLS